MLLIIFILVIKVRLLEIFYYEYEGLWLHIKNCIYNKCQKSAGIPIHNKYIDIIIKDLQKYDNMKRYTFIDFGCGEGKILNKFNDKFKRLIGIELDKYIIKIAKSKNAEYVWLGVWEKNPRAIKFYEKNGFVPFDKHIFKLGNDKQTDIMMKLKIN